jgi:amino acid transporter
MTAREGQQHGGDDVGASDHLLAQLSRRQTPVVAIGCLAVLTLARGLPLTYAYGGTRTFGYLAAAGGLAVVLVYLAVNVAVIRAFRTEFRDQFRLMRHLLIPAAAVVVFLFPLWGTIRPPAYTLVNLLPFIALGWLDLPALKLWAEHSCQLKEESSSNDAELHVVVAGVPLRSPVITCQG